LKPLATAAATCQGPGPRRRSMGSRHGLSASGPGLPPGPPAKPGSPGGRPGQAAAGRPGPPARLSLSTVTVWQAVGPAGRVLELEPRPASHGRPGVTPAAGGPGPLRQVRTRTPRLRLTRTPSPRTVTRHGASLSVRASGSDAQQAQRTTGTAAVTRAGSSQVLSDPT
jgi:hypothetical protein